MAEPLTVVKWVAQEEAQQHAQAPIGRALGGFFNPPVDLPRCKIGRPDFFKAPWAYTRALLLIIILVGIAAMHRCGSMYEPLIVIPGLLMIVAAVLVVRVERRIAVEQDGHLEYTRVYLDNLWVTARTCMATMRWKDYIATVPDEGKPYAEVLREVVKGQLCREGGLWHHNGPAGFPVFSDGKVAGFTLKGWGDFMAAVWSEEENKGYSYVHFQRERCPFIGTESPWGRVIN